MALHTAVTGDPSRPTIVFLHGAGVSSWMWGDQVRHLSDRFCCITIDLPGSGASATVPWESFAASADAVAEVIAATPTRRAHVVGLSLGGYVTVTLLAQHSDRVHNVVVSGITTDPLQPAWRNRMLTRVSGAVVRSPWLNRAYGMAMRLPPEALDAMAADARVLTATTTRRIYDEIIPYQLPSSFGGDAARILAVAADHDVPSVRRGLRSFAALGATVAEARNAHHAWNAEHPQLFSDMVEAWVTDRSVAPGLVSAPAPSGTTGRDRG